MSLEALVPQAQFYRHLETTLDLSVVRQGVTEHGADHGRPVIDLVVSFKVCPS